MELMKLPTELFEKILHDAFIERGLMQGVAMRLVNSKRCHSRMRPCTDAVAREVRTNSDQRNLHVPSAG
jgi:hypothetical protein